MIWNGNSVAKTPKDKAHSAAVNALCIHENVLLTGSNDETIKIWDADSLSLLCTVDAKSKLEGSVCKKIRALDVRDKRILVGTFGS
jgi:WD40 repeat protein